MESIPPTAALVRAHLVRALEVDLIGPYQDDERITADPAYGHIVCFCERVTAGEIRDTFASPIPPRDLDGLRRRTRAMNGRCQGFYCGAQVGSLLESRGENIKAAEAVR